MNDPERLLLDAGAGSFERSLLEAWNEDRPAPEARARTLAALGFVSGAAAAGGAASASIGPNATVTGSAALLKWIGVGIFALGLAAIVVATSQSDSSGKTAARIVTATPHHLDVAPAPAPSSPPRLDLDSNPKTPAPTPFRPPHAPRVTTAAGPDLSPQIALLDRARADLASGDAARANSLAAQYESEFPNGAFSQEAEVLRIEALLAQGDR
ncbi:MAG: hypothetical protein ACRELY_24705, partial [Polyangiaceae bacterium]